MSKVYRCFAAGGTVKPLCAIYCCVLCTAFRSLRLRNMYSSTMNTSYEIHHDRSTHEKDLFIVRIQSQNFVLMEKVGYKIVLRTELSSTVSATLIPTFGMYLLLRKTLVACAWRWGQG